jgi:hypothetical protein
MHATRTGGGNLASELPHFPTVGGRIWLAFVLVAGCSAGKHVPDGGLWDISPDEGTEAGAPDDEDDEDDDSNDEDDTGGGADSASPSTTAVPQTSGAATTAGPGSGPGTTGFAEGSTTGDFTTGDFTTGDFTTGDFTTGDFTTGGFTTTF